jgi:hypothetical protein
MKWRDGMMKRNDELYLLNTMKMNTMKMNIVKMNIVKMNHVKMNHVKLNSMKANNVKINRNTFVILVPIILVEEKKERKRIILGWDLGWRRGEK